MKNLEIVYKILAERGDEASNINFNDGFISYNVGCSCNNTLENKIITKEEYDLFLQENLN